MITTSIRVTPDVKAKIDTYAKNNYSNFSKMVVKALDEFVVNHKL